MRSGGGAGRRGGPWMAVPCRPRVATTPSDSKPAVRARDRAARETEVVRELADRGEAISLLEPAAEHQAR